MRTGERFFREISEIIGDYQSYQGTSELLEIGPKRSKMIQKKGIWKRTIDKNAAKIHDERAEKAAFSIRQDWTDTGENAEWGRTKEPVVYKEKTPEGLARA